MTLTHASKCTTRNHRPVITHRIGLLATTVLVALVGCRASPVNLAFMVVGDAVDSDEIKKLESRLIGQAPTVADEVFGWRLDTLRNVESDQQLLVYLVDRDRASRARYVVEVKSNMITALYKTMQDADGVGSAIQADLLRTKVVGREPDVAEAELGMGPPRVVLRSRRTGGLTRLYDASNATHFGAARYCILEFDRRNRCRRVRMVGVTASTKGTESPMGTSAEQKISPAPADEPPADNDAAENGATMGD